MIKVTQEKFKEIVENLKVFKKQENVNGFYDVDFCYGGERYLMISVNRSTGKVENFWWQIEFPVGVNFIEIKKIKLSCYDRLAGLAEAACGFVKFAEPAEPDRRVVQAVQPVRQFVQPVHQVVKVVQQVQQVQHADDWAARAQRKLDEKNRNENPVVYDMIHNI